MAEGDPARFTRRLAGELRGWLRGLLAPREPGVPALLDDAAASAARGDETVAFADRRGWTRGISGFIDHTAAAARHAWFRHRRDLRSGVLGVIRCGGDTDTTGAIAGGILGAAVGRAGLPAEWLDRLIEWPRTVAWMEMLARRLAGEAVSVPRRRCRAICSSC